MNYLNVSALESLLDLLAPHYACVYIRPHAGQHMPGYVFDNSGTGAELGDFELLHARFPQVAIFGELLAAHAPDLGFNEAQLRLHAQVHALLWRA